METMLFYPVNDLIGLLLVIKELFFLKSVHNILKNKHNPAAYYNRPILNFLVIRQNPIIFAHNLLIL